MGKIQIYQGGQVRAQGLANVPRGRHATAESFGAGRGRDLQNFGAAVQNAGAVVMDIANIKKRRIEDTEKRDRYTEAARDWREHEKELLTTRRGMDAKDLDKEAEKWFDERRDHYLGGLTGGNRQRAEFEQMYAAQRENAVVHMSRYSFQQVEIGEKLSRDQQNADFIEESAVKGLLNDGLVARNRALIHANVEANFRGQAPEVVAAARRDADAALFGAMVEAHAARSLENALEFLEREEVRGAFPDAKHRVMREGIRKAIAERDDALAAKNSALAAMDDAAAGMSENEARRRYYEDDTLTKEQAEAKLAVFKSARTASNGEAIQKADERKKQLENTYAEKGFNIAAMPPELEMTRLEQEQLVKWGNTFRASGGKNPPPDINYLCRLDAMTQAELQKYLLNPANSEEFYKGVGGAGSAFASEFIGKARGIKSEKRPLTDTNEGWAAARLAEDEDLILGSLKHADRINAFVRPYKILAKEEARRQGLANENDLSSEDREKIYQKLRAKGMYVRGWFNEAVSWATGGWLGTEERTFGDMLDDEDADFENFTLDSETKPETEGYPSSAGDDDFWEKSVGIKLDSTHPWAPRPLAPLPAVEKKPELPEAVKKVLGSDADWTPITDESGTMLYVRTAKKTPAGTVIRFLNMKGRTVSEETALAGQ